MDRATVASLEGLVEWCAKSRLFRRRDQIYAEILALDPEHTKARQKLQYEKRPDGRWVQSPRYAPPQDYTPAAQAEFETRRTQVHDEHAKTLLSVWSTASTLEDLRAAAKAVEGISGLRPSDPEPEAVLGELMLRLYRAARDGAALEEMEQAAVFLRTRHPEDPIVHATLREEPAEGGWRLKESVRTLEKAHRWRETVQAALEAVTLEPEVLLEVEQRVALPWKDGHAAPDVRVVGTAEGGVLATLTRYGQAAGAIFEKAIGKAPERRKGLTLYVFAAKGEFDAFLEKFPVVDNPTLRDRKTLGLDLVFTSGRGMAVKENPPPAQADLFVSTLFNQLLSDTCLGGGTPRGWHTEGISRYLAWRITGTRLSVGVAGGYAGQGGWREVPGSEDAWLGQARSALAKDPAIGLDLFLGKGLDAYTSRDSLLAYAFAVYLLDGFEAKAAAFVEAFEEESDADKACRRVLGFPRAVAERRLRRWLDEIAAIPEGTPDKTPEPTPSPPK